MNPSIEPVPSDSHPRGNQPTLGSDTTTPLVIYILYLLPYFGFVPPIIGIVLAYCYRGNATPLVADHYRFQIRTFWICLAYCAILVLIGLTIILLPLAYLLSSLVLIWLIVRCVRGIVSLLRREPPHNLETWLY